MSKYSVAKEVLAYTDQQAETEKLDPDDVLEALLVLAVQSFVARKGGAYAKDFLQYEIDSVSADGVFEVQKR